MTITPQIVALNLLPSLAHQVFVCKNLDAHARRHFRDRYHPHRPAGRI